MSIDRRVLIYALRTIARDREEIGVRMAIGATHQDVLSLIMREGLRPVAIGVRVGVAVSIGANRVLQVATRWRVAL